MQIIRKPAKVWYLELEQPKANGTHMADFRFERIFPVDIKRYRIIYKEVGGPWNWINRLIMTEEDLQAVLDNEHNAIYYCFYRKDFAGYFELNTHSQDFELVYFGLTPNFIGKGLGKQMMQFVIETAEKSHAKRLWLHTCAFDSPQALSFYLKSGFKIYKEIIEDQLIITTN